MSVVSDISAVVLSDISTFHKVVFDNKFWCNHDILPSFVDNKLSPSELVSEGFYFILIHIVAPHSLFCRYSA